VASKPFLTTVIGSFSRPEWLLKAHAHYSEGMISRDSFNRLIDEAIKLTIKEEELTGLDVITDGEQERTSFVGYPGEPGRVPGFVTVPREALNPRAGDILRQKKTLLTRIRAVCVDKVEFGDLGVADYLKASRWTNLPIKVTLPAPYLVMWEAWHSRYSKEPYPNPEDLAYDYASKVLRPNIEKLHQAGVNYIQLDEPMVGDLTEADEKPDRYHEALMLFYGQKYRGFKEELKLGIDLLDQATAGMSSDLRVDVHMDRWPNDDSPHYGEGYERFLPEMLEPDVAFYNLEYVSPGCGDPKVLAKDLASEGIGLGIGCVSAMDDSRVESVEEVVDFVKPLVPILGPEKISLVPTCGFAPGMGKKFDRNVAFAKLTNMVKAAEVLRTGAI